MKIQYAPRYYLSFLGSCFSGTKTWFRRVVMALNYIVGMTNGSR
jgi:hypothetical protein